MGTHAGSSLHITEGQRRSSPLWSLRVAVICCMQLLLLQMEDVIISRSRITYCEAFRHKSSTSSFPVFSLFIRDMGESTTTIAFHNSDINKSSTLALSAHSGSESSPNRHHHQQQRRGPWRPSTNYKNGGSKISNNSNNTITSKYAIVPTTTERKKIIPTTMKSFYSGARDWLFHMNTILEGTKLGTLDPTKLPYREIMNNWAKTRSTEGALVVEELWLPRLQKEVEMGNSMVVVGKDIYTIAIDAWAKRSVPYIYT